jgi:hypothetical protein
MPVWKSISKEHKEDQPTLPQFGHGLAERIQKFDNRNVEFDALRRELVIDNADRVNISDLYKEFMALDRHKRSPIRQRFLNKWREQMPVADRTKELEVIAAERQEALKLELKRAARRREKRLNKRK